LPDAGQSNLPSDEKAIVSSLENLGDKVKVEYAKPKRIKISVKRENLVEVAKFIRDNLHFDHPANVTGTDFPKQKELEITYHLGSIDGEGLRKVILAIGCRIPSDDPKVPTLIEIYPGFLYHERETAEMIGCTFEGHPDLTRLLLPEDWTDIPPMLKAYRLPGRLEGE
jgi:NADH:ubiquinone oxidoreductase subunit C